MSTSNISVNGITIDTFSGSSTYSSSFQQVLTRTVQTAELPIQLMQNQVNDLTNQQSALTSLGATFSQLQNAIASVASAAQGNTSASVSDTSILTASASSSALPGTYTMEVKNIGSAATAMSAAGSPPVTDPTTGNISSSSSFTLTANGSTYTITPTGTSLEDLANAINDSSAGVQATIVNVGGSSGADYRLALTSATYGQNTLQLADSGNNPLTTQIANGANVDYTVNGGSDIISTSRQITLAPGLTVNMVSQNSSEPVTITVANNQNGLTSALSSLATAYNAAVTAVANQRGQNGGALAGQSIVFTVQSMLSNLAQYSGAGNVGTLNNLGLSVDQTGQMSFNSSTFAGLSASDVQQFLGSPTTGGFLQSATNDLNSLTDTTSGSFASEYNTIQSEITTENSQITDAVARVNTMQSNLMAKLSQADAAIATLQSQTTYFTDLFQAQYGNPTTSGG